MSMVKLSYVSAFDTSIGVGMTIVEDPALMIKSASTIFGCDYSDLKPDADHIGIHLVALGAGERYSFNRNKDWFGKQACIKYHDTFVKHGSVFKHHRNKDREKRCGDIKASAYNHEMDRIELFIHAHKEKAREELQQLEKDGEKSFSMACRIPGDFCSLCGQFRTNKDDPNMCDHIRNELGIMRDDGKVAYMINEDPDWFDISFVGRPADRIAWSLKVAAGEIVDSVKLAEESGIWVPDYMAIESASGLSKLACLKRLEGIQHAMCGWLTKATVVKTASDRYMYELRKAAASFDEATLEQLRHYEPAVVFKSLAHAGVVMDPASFFKYATGPAYATDIAPLINGVTKAIPGVISNAVKNSECQTLCNDTTFDVATDRHMYLSLPIELTNKLAAYSCLGAQRDERIISVTLENSIPKFAVDSNYEMEFNTPQTVALAEKYAAYEIAAVDAILKCHKDTDLDDVLAVVAAQNLVE